MADLRVRLILAAAWLTTGLLALTVLVTAFRPDPIVRPGQTSIVVASHNEEAR